jgi:hypothetical protein
MKPQASPLSPLWAGKCYMRRSIPMSGLVKKDPKVPKFKAGISFVTIIGSKPGKQV